LNGVYNFLNDGSVYIILMDCMRQGILCNESHT